MRNDLPTVQSTETAVGRIGRALDRLSVDERSIYDRFVHIGGRELSADAAARLYGLYLQGVSCEDISRLNPAVDLATVLAARVRYNWDERKDVYVGDLMAYAGDAVRQTAAETVQLLGLMVAAASKKHGDALKRYLATGDESVLGEFDIKTIRQFRDVVEMMVRITGGDSKRQVVIARSIQPEAPVLSVQGRRLSPEEADSIRGANMK